VEDCSVHGAGLIYEVIGAGTEKQERAARRRDCTMEVARLGAQKEMDDIRDWWKVEAKRVKDELYSKICDSVGA